MRFPLTISFRPHDVILLRSLRLKKLVALSVIILVMTNLTSADDPVRDSVVKIHVTAGA